MVLFRADVKRCGKEDVREVGRMGSLVQVPSGARRQNDELHVMWGGGHQQTVRHDHDAAQLNKARWCVVPDARWQGRGRWGHRGGHSKEGSWNRVAGGLPSHLEVGGDLAVLTPCRTRSPQLIPAPIPGVLEALGLGVLTGSHRQQPQTSGFSLSLPETSEHRCAGEGLVGTVGEVGPHSPAQARELQEV